MTTTKEPKKPRTRAFSAWDLITVLGIGAIIGGLVGIPGVAVGVTLIAGAWAVNALSKGPKKPKDEKKG